MKISPIAIGTGHTDKPRVFCFDNLGEIMVSGGWDGKILAWNVPQISKRPEQPTKAVPLPLGPAHVYQAQGAAVSVLACVRLSLWPSPLLIAGDKRGALKVWDISEKRQLLHFQTPHCKVTALFVDESNATLYTAGDRGLIYAWQPTIHHNSAGDGSPNEVYLTLLTEFRGATAPVHQISLDLPQNLLICSGDEPVLYVWELPSALTGTIKAESPLTAHPAYRITFPEKAIYAFACSRQLPHLVCGGRKKKVYVLDYVNNTLLSQKETRAPICYISPLSPPSNSVIIINFLAEIAQFNFLSRTMSAWKNLDRGEMLLANYDPRAHLLAGAFPNDPTNSVFLYFLS